ncbi:hypothetical protein BX616_005148 [Lobosporangium transversale]|uniref:Sterol regulatory element-binding protein cleavage-activating protein n=1 Tax=Lobosporangium transversale TaxID=64571 RepID=A0A1Y2G583_9FUNG|nr:hypothetical protein BCR41DRAFT_426929 [Lobosporangium transversale]KAF9915883.1 hypothetical protein BX616_005148 [Lobosporangium transversale]ORY94326.1 hypothetical protein BCR41DRAFT_426929 [Lobosporangium transversale]|eukprot:XP_021875268.1 hypothetical protein BCR41DRAFT_426929 [Lobosporangium transversale]
MSVLSRIPGIAWFASFLSTTLSIHTNPTLRRYHSTLAQAFYHHGRLCASNQATVMVLVIVFVGMISYPGIITSYNSSTYVRQRSAAAALSSRNLSLSAWKYYSTELLMVPSGGGKSGRRRSHHPRYHDQHVFEGDLDLFWTQKTIVPTWTQDPEVFNRNLPSMDPLHFIAPIIINATELLLTPLQEEEEEGEEQEKNLVDTETNANFRSDKKMMKERDRLHLTPITTTDLLAYAAHIQRKLQNIEVEYSSDDKIRSDTERGAATSAAAGKDPMKSPWMISLKDICVLEPLEQNSDTTNQSRSAQIERKCLVHSPRDEQSTTTFGILSLDHHNSLVDEHPQASLIMAYYLRGDLGKNRRHHHDQQYDNKFMHKEGFAWNTLDVRRAWRLIFNRLILELQADLDQHDMIHDVRNPHKASPIATEDTLPLKFAPIGNTSLQFMVQGILPMDLSQTISRRLVTEENAQPRTNISAEYWLLAMAYFVMFLYISLSVGRVDLVKSKYGLGIAAVATVFVSLLMSIGLCSVFGVTLTLMPWEILPFMIIVVGVENINILVHAVVETSMDLPVKERVGRGLGTVGVSITMTLVAELCLLVIGAMTTIPAVQEFCTFAIAAVIMDYLLQMTFFITVISIDIRRLELSDLSTRSATAYSRYPFGTTRHQSIKPNGAFTYEDERSRHHRKDSTSSQNSDGGESKSSGKPSKANRKGRIFTSITMLGVMAYLGYIYGTTNQPARGETEQHGPITVSYWRILSSEDAAEFWTLIDPGKVGGYLEIESPAVVALVPSSSFDTTLSSTTCHMTPPESENSECEVDHDLGADTLNGVNTGNPISLNNDQLLDPRRPFKLLRDVMIFICFFAVWLVRVFVIPSIVLAAAILLLLSYLLSPQRKLLVDLQWRFPFIVLPGDYQSKRKLMMDELMTQEARELGQEAAGIPCLPLPGIVDTLHKRGHKSDIDQMDVSVEACLVLTSSMDGTILLWSGSTTAAVMSGGDIDQNTVPLVRLEEREATATSTKPGIQRSRNRPVKFLKLDCTGRFAIAGYGDNSIHVWKLDSITSPQTDGYWMERVPVLNPSLELVRKFEATLSTSTSTTDTSKLKVTSVCLWGLSLLVGYRDGQIWQWDLSAGTGTYIAECKHRGGVTELEVVVLDPKTREELGLKPKTYLVAAGKDGGIQCWSTNRALISALDITTGIFGRDKWTSLWSHSGLGTGVSPSVLTLDPEVPMVAVGYSNGAIKIWDLEHGNLVWILSRGLLSTPSVTHYARGRSQESPDSSHQPSHQGAITKLCFHALELEDGLTGEPAPRVWLVVSSSTDETVMIWIVEWEGLMGITTSYSRPSGPGLDSGTRREGVSTQYRDLPSEFTRSNSLFESTLKTSTDNSMDFIGTLSSSLPAPRLVGFMKQRGGKSITVSNSRLYGVRRIESTAVSNLSDTLQPPRQFYSSVLGNLNNNMRSRRKGEGGFDSSNWANAIATIDSPKAGNRPLKRGWELWEADLYQCIFKDLGVWSLNLSVRTLNLQSPLSSQQQQSRPFTIAPVQRQSATDTSDVMVSSNGSSMAMPVPVHDQSHAHHYLRGDLSILNPEMKPKLQQKPASFSYQGNHHRGHMYLKGPKTRQSAINLSPSSPSSLNKHGQSFMYPTQSGRNERPSVRTDGAWMMTEEHYEDSNDGNDDLESFLLPFVETKLLEALPRRISRQQKDCHSQQLPSSSSSLSLSSSYSDSGREMEIKDIVIGFGNFIKIVRLQDEDEEQDGEDREKHLH